LKELFQKKGYNIMVKLKVGRKILDISENDLILDNGACYQIVTQRIGSGFNKACPRMSKKLFNDLKNTELIFTSEELRQAAIKKYGTSVITYWKFNIERMQKLGY
jgi:hypothetical protein